MRKAGAFSGAGLEFLLTAFVYFGDAGSFRLRRLSGRGASAAAHLDAALSSTPRHFGGKDLAFLDDVLDIFGAAFGQLRDVDQSVLLGQHFP